MEYGGVLAVFELAKFYVALLDEGVGFALLQLQIAQVIQNLWLTASLCCRWLAI
jgi:hypothetical protein